MPIDYSLFGLTVALEGDRGEIVIGTSCDGFNCVRQCVRGRLFYRAKSNFDYGGWHTDSMCACCM